MEGWQLVTVSFDSSQSNTAKTYVRLRNLNEQIGIGQSNNGWVWNDLYPTKSDIFLGGNCEAYNKRIEYGPMMTIARLYVWKTSSNIVSTQDSVHDKFFFRQNGNAMPSCFGVIPCKFCVVNYPMPISFNVKMGCTTEGTDATLTYLAKWEFDEDPGNTQYILDQSIHKRHIIKGDVNNVSEQDPIRIFGQGYLLYGLNKVLYVQSVPQLNNYPQFTIQMWVRKVWDQGIYDLNDDWGFVPIDIVDGATQTKVFFRILLSDKNQMVYYWMENGIGQNLYFPGFMNTTKWHFVSVMVSTYYNLYAQYNSYYYSYVKTQVDSAQQKLSYQNQQPTISFASTPIMKIWNKRSIMLRSMRIFGYAMIDEEVNNNYATSTCTSIGNQPGCDICPSETGKCLSMCNETQYGDSCSSCHQFCGHCKGPLSSDCTFCARNVTPANVFYSATFGNCSCISGMYYDKTPGIDQCVPCHANCKECFGPSQSQCMKCATGKAFYPNSICVSSCSDPLVVGTSLNGFYIQTETLGGQSQMICIKCHPFCAQCTGGMSTQCQSCLQGYFLLGSTCSDTCPDGKYPNLPMRICSNCHIDCATCSGPLNTQCITCVNPLYYQQTGKCQVECNDGFYPDASKVCQPCHEYCGTCTNKFSSTCGSCTNGYFLQPGTSECKSTCPAGYYGDIVTHACLMCHYSCKTCSGYGTDTCTACAEGFLTRGSLCVEKCADSEFAVDGTCKSCDPKCSSCFGIKDNECNSCNENTITTLGYYFIGTSCLESCERGYYPDNQLKICKPCNSKCQSCISDTYCTSCIDGPYQLNDGECSYFSCLDTEYRVIKPSLSCYQCDSSCLTCQGKSEFDCLSCRPKDQLVAQQCLTCDEQPGMTEPTDDSITGCVEICGDGFNYGYFQCDDGNLINGDGCSSTCTIESGFNCTAGSKTGPSACMDNQNPSPTISLVTASNLLLIQFDEEVILNEELTTSNLIVTIKGPQSAYKFEWKLQDQYKTTEPVQLIGIQLSFYQTLKEDSKEQVSVVFQNSTIYKDATGNGMILLPMYAYLNKYDYIDPETKAKLESAGDTSMLATFGAVAVNLAISLVFGGSISAMWTMVNTIQLISLLPLCNINYPKITVLVFQKMLGSHGESAIIPNIFYDLFIKRTGSNVIVEPPLTSKFEEYGWTVSNFIYLSGRKIVIWTLIIIAYPFVWYMQRRYADKHKFCKLWNKIEQKFRYTLLLRGVIMSYVSMYLAFILGIFQMNLTTMENTISAFSAIAFGIILTYLPIHLMNILQRNYQRVQTPKFMLSYSTIVKEVNLSHPIKYMYYPVFLLRRALFSISLVLFANSPFNQIMFMSFTSFVMIIYIILIKPQKERIMIVLTALGEALLLFMHCFSLVFLDEELTEEKADNYGWLMIILVGFYILANWVIIVSLTIKQLRQTCKDKQKQKQLDKLKQIEDVEYKKWKKKRQVKNRMQKEEQKYKMIEALDDANYQKSSMQTQEGTKRDPSQNFLQIGKYRSGVLVPSAQPGLFHNLDNFDKQSLGNHIHFSKNNLNYAEEGDTYRSNFSSRNPKFQQDSQGENSARAPKIMSSEYIVMQDSGGFANLSIHQHNRPGSNGSSTQGLTREGSGVDKSGSFIQAENNLDSAGRLHQEDEIGDNLMDHQQIDQQIQDVIQEEEEKKEYSQIEQSVMMNPEQFQDYNEYIEQQQMPIEHQDDKEYFQPD